MRRGLADSVERLRKAPKSDIPPILEVMRRQTADLAQVRGRKGARKTNPQLPHHRELIRSPNNTSTVQSCDTSIRQLSSARGFRLDLTRLPLLSFRHAERSK